MTHLSKICVSFLIVGFLFVGPGQAQIDPDSILGVWLLDEGQGDTTADASGNGNDGTLMATPDWAAGQFGAALDFAGSSSYVDCGNAASLNVDVFSVSFWCHFPATQGWNHMISRGSHVASGTPGSVNWGVMMYTDQETILYETFNDTGWVGIQAPVSAGEWHHLAATLDTTAMQVYVDGQLAASASGGVLLDESRSFVIGARSDAGGAGGYFSGRLDEVGYFNTVLTPEDIQLIMSSGLTEILGGSDVAVNPQPADGGSDIPRDSALSWMPGVSAHTHDVYFGTDVGVVSNASVADPQGVLAGQGLTDTALDVGTLAFEQTYYWRVDEVNAAPDNTVFKGNIWSFTVEPKAIPITNIAATASGATPDMGPENTVNGSGLDSLDQHSMMSQEMWLTTTDGSWIQYEFDTVYKLHELLVWNSNQAIEAFIGFGVKEMTVEYSADGETWSALDGTIEIPRASGLPTNTVNAVIDMGGAMAKLVKLSVVSAHGFTGQSGLSEVRFMSIPVLPREPQPANGATVSDVDVQLSWRSGREAAAHEVYMGTDPSNMALLDASTDAMVDTGVLDYMTTYAWSVTEVNEAADPTSHAGEVWTFSTPEYAVVDDFESYGGDEGEEIFMTWFDGFGGDTSLGGSTTGHIDAPFVETTSVNSGSQSMPVYVDNDGGFFDIDGKSSAPNFSEVLREFAPSQDWTTSGIKTLSIMFAGSSGLTGQLYCKIGTTKLLYDGAPTNLGSSAWQAWNIDLSTVGGNLASVRELAIGVEGGTSGILYIDDIRLYTRVGEKIAPVDPGTAGLVAQYTFEGNLQDSSGNGRHGTVVGDAATIVVAQDPERGQVLSLPGGDDQYVVVGAVGISGNDPTTIACWAKADNTSIPDWSLIFGFTTDGGGTGSHFNVGSLGGPGGIGAHVWGWEETMVSDADGLNWHHYAMTYDGSTIRYFADGMPIDTDKVKSNAQDLSPRGDNVHFGKRGDTHTNSFPGDVDDAFIYNRVLTDGEILHLAGGTSPVHKPF